MKILHVAHDPRMARVPPDAIHAIAQNVTLTCVASPASALEWLRRNTDTAAVIVEVEAQSGAPFVQELRAACLDTPVLVVSGSGRLDNAVAALNSGADGYLPAGSSIERELPELVVTAIDRANGRTRERREMAGELEALRRQLVRDGRTCVALQQQSLQLEDAFVRLEKRRADEAAAFAELLDSRRRMFDERCAGVVESRDALAAQLASTSVALEREREARATDGEAARTAYSESARRHAEEIAAADARFADVVESRDALAAQLASTSVALERERAARATDGEAARTAYSESARRHAEEIAAADARFADLDARHIAALAEHLAVRTAHTAHEAAYTALEQQLAEAQSNHKNLLARTVAERAAAEEERVAAATRFAALELRHRDALAEHADARRAGAAAHAMLERRLADAQADHQRVLERTAVAAAAAEGAIIAAEARFAALESQHNAALAEHTAVSEAHAIACESLERRLAEAESNRRNIAERAAADRAVAENEIAGAVARFADLASRHTAALEDHAAVREEHARAYAALEHRLADAQSTHQNLIERAAADGAAAEAELANAVAARQQAEHRADRLIAEALTREAALLGEIENESAARAVAESNASATRMAAARGRDRSLLVVSRYRQRVQAARLQDESNLRGATAETARLQRSLDELQSVFQQLDELAGDHAAARFHLEALVAQRDKQLAEETERHLVVEEDARRAMSRLQKDGETLRREIDGARAYAEAIRDIADRVPDLEAQLERTSREKRSQFERAPYGLCRCSSAGTVIEANHSFVALLGYRRAEDLRDLSWLTAADERAGDLGWLLERARTTRKAETVETQWTTREGRRLLLRLQALVTAEDAIDIVAEDITALREVEGRLRQAQKMEAVGRLASEVAVTCEALLGDVVRSVQEWTGRTEFADIHVPAERLVEDVRRARGFLRRLDSHVDEQKRALEPVSAQRVLRDLAPVLRRLVGERIALVLPKSGGVFPVDVDAERLERVLINVVGYARERMPQGGQVKIDLATTAIGRRFVAGHSNVRAGDHVLITVTELPGSAAMHGDVQRKERPADAAGMELGVLVDLISSSGGHLWLEAQPAGNMVVKIHLPKLAIKEERGGRLSQWLRAASVANIVT